MSVVSRYNVEVTVTGHSKPDIDNILDELSDYHPALSDGPRPGTIQGLLTVPADSLRQAITTALTLVATATGWEPVGCEAMTEAEFDRRAGFTPVPDLVGTTEAAAILGVTRQSVLQMHNTGRLSGTRVGGRHMVFNRADVERIAAQRATSTR